MSYIDVYKFWEALDTDYSVATANGMASVTAHQAFELRPGKRLLTNAGLGHMGSGLPLAIGAHVATGEPIICSTGDGSTMFNLQELQTIVYHKMPIKIFIFNNGGYWSIRNTHKNYFNKEFASCPKTGVGLPNFEKVAYAFGIKYYKIASDRDLKKLPKMLRYKGAVICELMIDPDQKLLPKWTAGQYRT